MQALVSIIIPSFNREDLLSETLDSVLNQTYENWECIIVDDDSTDTTPQIGRRYAAGDRRIVFLKRPAERPKGAASCRNVGLESAKGEYIQFLDSDDLLHSAKLEFQIKCLMQNDELSLATGKWGWFNGEKQLKDRFKFCLEIYRNYKKPISLLNDMGLFNTFFPPHIYLLPKALIELAGKWNEKLSNNDDGEFFTRIILKASKILFVPEALAYYRIDNTNKLSELSSEDKFESAILSWKLIETHIRREYPSNSSFYVRNAKFILYDSLYSQYPELARQNCEFFRDKKNYVGIQYKIFKEFKKKKYF